MQLIFFGVYQGTIVSLLLIEDIYLQSITMQFLSKNCLYSQFSDYGAQVKYDATRSLGALRALTSSWRPFEPLDFVLHALRALRPCDPRIGDWIVC